MLTEFSKHLMDCDKTPVSLNDAGIQQILSHARSADG